MTADDAQIVETVSAVFAALGAGDIERFEAAAAPGFYIFENGVRFDASGIFDLIKVLHAAGRRFEWKIAEPDVRSAGDIAWIAYTNQGSVTDASGTQKREWLESACLEKRDGRWRIAFMHSTRVPAAR